MSAPGKAAFVYGPASTTLATTVPMRAPVPRGASYGGFSRVASGSRDSFRVGPRERLLVITVRVYEGAQWVALEALVDWAQDHAGTPFLFYPDGLAAAAYSVYLDTPKLGEPFAPTRASDDPAVFEAQLVLAKADGTSWAYAYFAEPA
jgi:hypothetical protein